MKQPVVNRFSGHPSAVNVIKWMAFLPLHAIIKEDGNGRLIAEWEVDL